MLKGFAIRLLYDLKVNEIGLEIFLDDGALNNFLLLNPRGEMQASALFQKSSSFYW